MITKIPKTISEARDMFASGELTPTQLVEHYISVIKEKDAEINAVLEIFEDAKTAAKVADRNIREGKPRELEGIPFLIKDNILYKGHIASAASLMLQKHVAAYNSTTLDLILREGAIVLGRTNMDDAALGSSGESSAFGPTKNPVDMERVPGGTSSGSAAALAAGMCLVALGTDTGGSVRQPASFCGVFGMKGTYGIYSRSGIIAAASSLEGPGILANSAEDVLTIHKIVAQADPLDNTSIPNYIREEFSKNENISSSKKVIGYPKEYLEAEGLNREVKENFFNKLEDLKKKGYEVREISFDTLKYSISTYYIINVAEVSTNLSRLDGLRYGGGEVRDVKNYQELFAKNRGNFFGKEIKRRIMIGSYVLSHGYYDAYYGKALLLRDMMKQEFGEVFKNIDFLAMPTAPTTAWKFGEIKDPLSLYLEDIFTVPANLAGIPAISIPNGVDTNNMPIGFQLLAPYMADEKLLEFVKNI